MEKKEKQNKNKQGRGINLKQNLFMYKYVVNSNSS